MSFNVNFSSLSRLSNELMQDLKQLKQLDLSGALRGEQLYCLARKRGDASTVRRPEFLYEQPPAV